MTSARAVKIWLGVVCAVATVVTGAKPMYAQTHAQPATSTPGSMSGSTQGSMSGSADARLRSIIDPTLRILHRASSRTSHEGSLFEYRDSFNAERVEVSLRFDGRASPAEIEHLRQLGVRILGNAFAEYGLYRASVPWPVLDAVAARPGVERIEAIWQAQTSAPLEQTNTLIHATSARLHPPTFLQGQGVRVGLIDTGIDVLHPAMFRPDGGHYAWLDIDGDGVFSPGQDAVDLNANGSADSNEKLGVLDATVIVDFEDGQVENADGELDTNRDWLYADMNSDGVRNAGSVAGFNESTPAYGEALFVVDDADRSGTLDPDEKLVRLGTSKIARYVTEDASYERGEDLIAAASESVDAFHGTGVAGILMGGQAPYHDRVGVAPGADVFVYGLSATLQRNNDLPLRLLEAARRDDVDVLLHEWTNAFTQPLDGSTNFEAAMSAAREDGTVHVNPVGNLNESKKHTIVAVQPGTPAMLTFEVGDGFDGQSTTLPYTSAFGSLQWRQSHPALAVELTAPSGESRTWRMDTTETVDMAGATVEMAFGRTPRDNAYLEFYLESNDPDTSLEQGAWSIELTGFASDDEIWGRITDEYSNWRPGIGWSDPTVGRGTVAFPATADTAFGVGAYAGRHSLGGDGEAAEHRLRSFSGHGPRLDGRPVVALTAPDDPFVPLAATPKILDAGWGRSWFTAFAGTSGAAPHVAGSIALMQGLEPDATPDQIEQRLVDSARGEDLKPEPASLPGAGWGYGKLDAYAALFGQPAPELGDAPVAALALEVGPDEVTMDGSASEPNTELEYRFDVDYDGAWDTEWGESARHTFSLAEAGSGEIWARLEVRNALGQRSGAVARWRDGQTGGDAADVSGDGGPDGGTDAGVDPPGDGGCCSHTTGQSSLPWPWLLVVCGAYWVRRRSNEPG